MPPKIIFLHPASTRTVTYVSGLPSVSDTSFDAAVRNAVQSASFVPPDVSTVRQGMSRLLRCCTCVCEVGGLGSYELYVPLREQKSAISISIDIIEENSKIII